MVTSRGVLLKIVISRGLLPKIVIPKGEESYHGSVFVPLGNQIKKIK